MSPRSPRSQLPRRKVKRQNLSRQSQPRSQAQIVQLMARMPRTVVQCSKKQAMVMEMRIWAAQDGMVMAMAVNMAINRTITQSMMITMVRSMSKKTGKSSIIFIETFPNYCGYMLHPGSGIAQCGSSRSSPVYGSRSALYGRELVRKTQEGIQVTANDTPGG